MTTTLLKELTKDLESVSFISKDFKEMKGMKFEYFVESMKLKRVLQWDMEVITDEEGPFLYFELLGEFKYKVLGESGSELIEEIFILRVDHEGTASIEMKDQPTDYKVEPDAVDPILKKMGLI